MQPKRTKHSVYNLNYHIVLVTKYRHRVLEWDVEAFVKQRLVEVCEQYKWDLMEYEVMPEHLHIFVSAPPSVAPLKIASTLKSIIAVDVFRQFPRLKKTYFWGSGLWSDGCYYGSAGSVTTETIRKYIAEQKLS